MAQELTDTSDGCKTCRTCAYWADAPNHDYGYDWKDERTGARICSAIRPYWIIEEEATKGVEFPSRPDSEPFLGVIPPERQARIDAYQELQNSALRRALAYVEDVSTYYAALKTISDFGCIKHQARPIG